MRLSIFLLLALPVLAQQEKLVSISGTVIDSATGEPVKRAQVKITHFGGDHILRPGETPPPPLIRSVLTDATGAFRFDGVPDGDYGCTA